MGAEGAVQESAAADAALAVRLRRVNVIALVAGIAWVVLAAACTLWFSERTLSRYVADAEKNVEREAESLGGIIDHALHELASIASVLSTNRELRITVGRYNARGPDFHAVAQEKRRAQLLEDPDVVRINKRLSQIRHKLDYDLVYALDSRGVRVVTSDWDRPLAFLGEQLADRQYFKDAVEKGEGYMFAVSRMAKTPALFFSAAIQEEGGVIGAVVVRQDSAAIGTLLAAGSRRTALVVDSLGMVIATSHPEFALRHLGALTDKRPDADTLRGVYAQERLITLGAGRPPRPLHDAEWVIAERSYLVTKAPLKTLEDYSLVVLRPIDWVGRMRGQHYVIGALVAVFGVLIALLANRGAASFARRHHHAQVTAALNEKLTKVNADKDKYLGIAAHDLRNPLSSMRGLSQMMMEMPLEPEQQKEFLETIHRTSDEMLGLVNDLLDVSVIESGKLTLRRSDQDMTKLIRQRIHHLEPHARNKKIDLKLEANGAQQASVDSARFGQVIDNLVSNAIKFSPSGTTVQVALTARDGNFAFSVQDQGPGISEAERRLLFRSFQKLSARPTAGEKSTGLGLAIVKKIVDAHGGHIDVDSAPGSGTRFTVTAPLAPAQGANP